MRKQKLVHRDKRCSPPKFSKTNRQTGWAAPLRSGRKNPRSVAPGHASLKTKHALCMEARKRKDHSAKLEKIKGLLREKSQEGYGVEGKMRRVGGGFRPEREKR